MPIYPIGPRTMFTSHTFLCFIVFIIAKDLENTVFSDKKIIKRAFLILLVCLNVLRFSTLLARYIPVYKLNEVRISYIEEQLSQGLTNIEIIELPDFGYLHNPNKSYAYKYSFNLGNRDEMNFSIITYEEYLEKHPD